MGGALGMECLHAFAEIIRLPEAAVAVSLELDCGREHCVLGIVEKLLGRALVE
jgi:hypothetical protein